MSSAAICVMAKAPVPGQVKTRLCPPLGPAQAAQLAAAFLLDTWESAGQVAGALRLLAWSGERAAFPAQLAAASGFAQPGGDLGQRLIGVARAALARAERVLIVGSDLPGLPAAQLEAALARLGDCDAVLGPSADGGYHAIGLRRAEPGLLDGLPWSQPSTLAATRARLRERGYRVAEAPAFDDVDDAADLERLRAAIAAGTVDAPATRAALQTLCSFPSSSPR